MQWSWEKFNEYLPFLLKALPVTIEATFAGFVISAVFGLLLAMARRTSFKQLKWLSIGFVSFVRNTPLLVQVYFIYNVLPKAGITLTPFLAGSIALGLHYSTYLSEVYRSGIDGVQKGQWEASIALNFSKLQTWTKVILPQAIPPIVPVIGNYLIMMFKETPILSAITLLEMLGMAKKIGAHDFRYLEAITTVGVLFLILSYPSSLFVNYLDRRLNRNRA